MIVHVTKDNFKDVIDNNKVVLIDFYATWCGPCRMLGPVLEELDKENLVKIGKVNVDEEDDLSAAFGISSIPALFLVKDGKVVKKTLGYQGLEALKEFVK